MRTEGNANNAGNKTLLFLSRRQFRVFRQRTWLMYNVWVFTEINSLFSIRSCTAVETTPFLITFINDDITEKAGLLSDSDIRTLPAPTRALHNTAPILFRRSFLPCRSSWRPSAWRRRRWSRPPADRSPEAIASSLGRQCHPLSGACGYWQNKFKRSPKHDGWRRNGGSYFFIYFLFIFF